MAIRIKSDTRANFGGYRAGDIVISLSTPQENQLINAGQADRLSEEEFWSLLSFSGNRVLGQSGVAQTVTAASTAEEVLAQVAIPAGALGINGSIRVKSMWTGTNNANVKTTRYRLGATALGGSAFFAHTSGLTSQRTFTPPEVLIWNRGVANSQVAFSVTSGGAVVSSGNDVAPFTEDTSLPLIVSITGQKATGSDTLTLEAWTIELLRP